LTPLASKLLRAYHTPTLSNASIAKKIIWPITINVHSGETTSIENGTPTKLRRPRKLEPIRFA